MSALHRIIWAGHEGHSRTILSCDNPRCTRYILRQNEVEEESQTCHRRTPDVFLFRCGLIWAGSFLDINYQFMLGLVFINWAGGIMYFVTTVNVEARTPSIRPGGRVISNEYTSEMLLTYCLNGSRSDSCKWTGQGMNWRWELRRSAALLNQALVGIGKIDPDVFIVSHQYGLANAEVDPVAPWATFTSIRTHRRVLRTCAI